MRAILVCFLVSFLHVLIISLVGVSSRRLEMEPHRHHPFVKEQAIRNLNSLQMTMSSNEAMKSNKLESSKSEEISQIGSSPPSCEHKCYGCSPCVAIQVPTTTGHVGLHYTNYEPEGWKCKCGPIFFSP